MQMRCGLTLLVAGSILLGSAMLALAWWFSPVVHIHEAAKTTIYITAADFLVTPDSEFVIRCDKEPVISNHGVVEYSATTDLPIDVLKRWENYHKERKGKEVADG